MAISLGHALLRGSSELPNLLLHRRGFSTALFSKRSRVSSYLPPSPTRPTVPVGNGRWLRWTRRSPAKGGTKEGTISTLPGLGSPSTSSRALPSLARWLGRCIFCCTFPRLRTSQRSRDLSQLLRLFVCPAAVSGSSFQRPLQGDGCSDFPPRDSLRVRGSHPTFQRCRHRSNFLKDCQSLSHPALISMGSAGRSAVRCARERIG